MTDRLPTTQSLEARPRETMAQAAFASLREQIVMGAIPQGAPLRLEELARTLNMSISPIREAIRQLEVLGLAEASPYKGARVTYLTISELQIVHDTRVGLESLAVRHSAIRGDEDLERDLTACIEALDKAHALGDRAGLVHGNTRYHLTLARGSGSPWLAGLISQTLEIWERYSAAVTLLGRPDDTFAVEAEGHREILRACVAQDPDAAERAIRDHLGVSKAIFEQGAPPTLALRPGIDA